jgi:hypothetical protein
MGKYVQLVTAVIRCLRREDWTVPRGSRQSMGVIVVGMHEYKVFLTDEPDFCGENPVMFGEVDFVRGVIRISASLPAGRREEVFYHELAHVVIWNMRGEGGTEVEANCLAMILLSLRK